MVLRSRCPCLFLASLCAIFIEAIDSNKPRNHQLWEDCKKAREIQRRFYEKNVFFCQKKGVIQNQGWIYTSYSELKMFVSNHRSCYTFDLSIVALIQSPSDLQGRKRFTMRARLRAFCCYIYMA